MSYTTTIQEAETLEETAALMRERLQKLVPEVEIGYKAELAFEINRLKKEMNAVILGHNYMEPALYHSVPDYVGDSLELSRISAETDADVIVFCGVQFMAETAKILNPGKTVLIPSDKAGCSLAEGITATIVVCLLVSSSFLCFLLGLLRERNHNVLDCKNGRKSVSWRKNKYLFDLHELGRASYKQRIITQFRLRKYGKLQRFTGKPPRFAGVLPKTTLKPAKSHIMGGNLYQNRKIFPSAVPI